MSHDISFILVIVSNGLNTAYHSLGFDNAQGISVSISAGLSLIIPSLATQNGPLWFWQNPEVSHSQITQGHDLLVIACYYTTITPEIVFDTIWWVSWFDIHTFAAVNSFSRETNGEPKQYPWHTRHKDDRCAVRVLLPMPYPFWQAIQFYGEPGLLSHLARALHYFWADGDTSSYWYRALLKGDWLWHPI